MRLLDEWRKVSKKAWSFRLALLAAVLTAADVVVPQFSDVLPRNVFVVLAFVTSIAAAIARLIAQPEMHNDD